MNRIAAATFALGVLATPALSQEVGEVGVDWLGNDIIVEAFKDPEVDGVTCHVSYFERGVIDRLQKGNWFEDPSDSSIACRQTGPISFPKPLRQQDEMFSERISLVFKKLRVVRMVDRPRNTLVYLTYSDRVIEGSPQNSVTAVPVDRGTPIPLR